MLPGPKPVEDPAKELRFTRSSQAAAFAILGAILAGASIAMLLLNVIPADPILPWWWPLVPLPPALLLFRLAYHCVRHAYIILTPLGIEIFPFFRPRRNLQVLYWSEIADAEVSEAGRLVIHFDEERTSGIIASLAPLPPVHRDLLAEAIEGRMVEREEKESPDTAP